MTSRQACRLCRRRKVKCDGLPTCRNCYAAETACQYSPPKKRGPKPLKSQQETRPSEHSHSLGSPYAATDSSAEVESPALPSVTNFSWFATPSSPQSSIVTADYLFATPENQTQAAINIHLNLLVGLLAVISPETSASFADQCILLYTRYVFGSAPICHEPTLRETVRRFFVSISGVENSTEDQAQISRCFAADDERGRIGALRNITLITALCTSVAYNVPDSLLPKRHLAAPLFLRAARETLRIYEDYDIEHPNSSSLAIRLLLSSAIQTATGNVGVAFHILSEAGLIAMKMRLYDERSLERRDALEETLLRNAFWQLYVCDKTALVMKSRPITIHETLFEPGLTLEAHSRSFVPLFDYEAQSNSAEIENRLLEGFHVIRRLWAIAAQVIRGMEIHSKRTLDPFTAMEANRESVAKISQAYFEMITSANNLPALVESPVEPCLDINQNAKRHLFNALQRQRTSYLVTLHSIKSMVLNYAIQCNMTEIMGLNAEPLTLATRQIELAQDFLNVLESVPFLHLKTDGEHCAEKIRRVGSMLLELAHGAENDVVKSQANQCAMRLIDMVVRLDSKASDVLDQDMSF